MNLAQETEMENFSQVPKSGTSSDVEVVINLNEPFRNHGFKARGFMLFSKDSEKSDATLAGPGWIRHCKGD